MVAVVDEQHATDHEVVAVDLGSNSFHLLLAKRDKNGLQSLVTLGRKVQLGLNLRDNKLCDQAIDRGLDCLREFAAYTRGRDPGTVRIVGTHALRKANDTGRFIEAAQALLGHPVDIISGEEEASLIYQGVEVMERCTVNKHNTADHSHCDRGDIDKHGIHHSGISRNNNNRGHLHKSINKNDINRHSINRHNADNRNTDHNCIAGDLTQKNSVHQGCVNQQDSDHNRSDQNHTDHNNADQNTGQKGGTTYEWQNSATHENPKPRLVVDVGGGSTELVVGCGETITHATSVPVGCVALLSHFPDGTITEQAFINAYHAAFKQFAGVARRYHGAWQQAIGCSGTLLAVGQVLKKRPDAIVPGIHNAALQSLRSALLTFDTLAAVNFKGLSERRRSVFTSGLAIVLALFDSFKIDSMALSKAGLREGLAWQLLQQHK